MWQSLHCAVQGRGHAKNQIPCQDKTYALQKHNVYAIALADGAGSAKLSHFGAESIVSFIARDMVKCFDNYFSQECTLSRGAILEKLQKRLNSVSLQYRCLTSDLACTLLCVAIKGNRFIMLHIGDGVIGCLKDKRLEVLSSPHNGEFSNVTSFITSQDALASMRLICDDVSRISGFILMSDGAQFSLYNKQEGRLAPVLQNIMQSHLPMSKLKIGLQNSLEKTIKNATTDDCSIAFLFRRKCAGYSFAECKKFFKR